MAAPAYDERRTPRQHRSVAGITANGLDAASVQRVCTECGTPFVARTALAKTCCDAHRIRRSRRRKRQGADFTEFDTETGTTQAAMEAARQEALDDLPAVAREVLAEALRPVVREKLTDSVLQSIGAMIDLLPLAQDALREDLLAVRPLLDGEGDIVYGKDGEPVYTVDGDRRSKATALVLKYTVGQPGLSPQPEAPAQAPMVVNFNGMPAPTGFVDSTAEQVVLGLNERLCDTCDSVKDVTLFVGGSSRCEACHEANRARVQLAIEERTANAS